MGKAAITAAISVLLSIRAADAQETGTPSLSFDGYGTLGVLHSNEERADFIPNVFDPDGAGHTRSWSPEVDSRLGLQFSADVTQRLSAIVQVVAEQRYDDSWTPTLEWANVKYQFTPDFYVRAGRMVLPTLMVSDYRKVGYALPWIRPPTELYGVVPVTNTDGVEVSYRFNVGQFTNTVRLTYGGKDEGLPNDAGDVEIRDALTVTDTLERGAVTVHAGYWNIRATVEALNPLFDAFRQFGPPGAALADRFDFDRKRIRHYNVGARYDPGDWFLMGEWARLESDTFRGTSQGWYVSGGYRYKSFTPYLTFARTEARSETSTPGLSLAGLPPPVAAAAQGLNATLNGLLSSIPQQDSVTGGLRWDFASSFALKLEYQYIDLDSESAGFLSNQQPGFNRGGSVSLFSATIDFVF